MMNDRLPDPLTPAGCDLRDFAFMLLDAMRLRDSDFAALASGDEFRAGVLLWCAAWHQVPAASLPDDDRLLCKLAGYGRAELKTWTQVRDGALRGFVKCRDGRLYHPVIAEKAVEAIGKKLSQRARTLRATEVRRQRYGGTNEQHDDQRDAQRNDVRHDDDGVIVDDDRDDVRNVHQGTGTGTIPNQEGEFSSVGEASVSSEVQVVSLRGRA